MCVSVVNYDTAETNYKSKTERISGYFEIGKREEKEIPSCGIPRKKYNWGKVGINYQMGKGTKKFLELGIQLGGGIGSENIKEVDTLHPSSYSYSFFDLYFLGYLKFGGRIKPINMAFKLAYGGIPCVTEFCFLPLGYSDIMLGFLNPEKLTIYTGVNWLFLDPYSYRLGINLHFNEISLITQISFRKSYFGIRKFFSFKFGTGFKF